MAITTNTSVGAGVNTSSRDSHNVAFPTRDGGNKSHVITVADQPIVIRSADYPAGIAAKFQITPDGGRLWTDWKVHGQQVLVSENNPFQWISFSGQYRLVLIDEATGAEYAGQAQPLVTFFASTQTHEHEWSLVPVKVDVPVVPPIPTTVTTRLIANAGGTFSLVVGVNGVEATPLLLLTVVQNNIVDVAGVVSLRTTVNGVVSAPAVLPSAIITSVENTLANGCALGGPLTLRTIVNGVIGNPVDFPCPSAPPATTVSLATEDFCYAVGVVNLKATVNGIDSNTVGIPCPRF
jgi:hypothetical protein